MASVIDAFLDYAIRRDAESTYYERKLYLQKFADVHGGRLVRDCRPYHLTSWVDDHPTWRSDWTKSYAIRNVKRPFNWAKRQGLIAANPFADVEHRPGDRRRPMTDVEFNALLKNAGRDSRLGEALQFMAATGCRPCELRRLSWSEVDLESGLATIVQHKTSRTRKDRKPRLIVLIPTCVALLKRIRKSQQGGEHVFLSQRGRPWARCSLQQALRRLRRVLKLPDDVFLYGLRHRFGTNSVKGGNDLKSTAELLGHATTRMTEHYVHLAGDLAHLRSAMQRAARSRKGA
ncbi:MAG: tyrosine-type recombinase/integrase [Pirellulales bacterium]|nr:tyrosine-type recombinase/integrase [Pirellulales bacterium]